MEKKIISKNDKIFLAGHKGLVGSAVYQKLKDFGYKNIIVANRQELNLLSQSKVFAFVKKIKPKAVIICAAKVGGVNANNTKKADFLYENITIQNKRV